MSRAQAPSFRTGSSPEAGVPCGCVEASTAGLGTKVPVPATYLLCADTGVIGAPFYVMEKVGGTAYRTAAQLEAVGAERTRLIAARMIGTLADLHAVDPGAVGLADFGRPQGFLGRQVRRWKKQLDASRSRDLPGADELYAALEAHIPAETDVAIVHGDFRLDNLLVGGDDRITAVLDWEMATLGDPLADVALLLAYQALAHLENRIRRRGRGHGARIPRRGRDRGPVRRAERPGPVEPGLPSGFGVLQDRRDLRGHLLPLHTARRWARDSVTSAPPLGPSSGPASPL